MKRILSYAIAETEVKHSHFCAEAFPLHSQEEARDILKQQKIKYKDAAHVVHAFVLGPSGDIAGCSDDGEPSGTAGRPVLDILKGSGITGVIITVTRWFGGTLLGTGGLVKAYGDAIRTVLSHTLTEEIVPLRSFSLTTDYATIDAIKRMFPLFDIRVAAEEYGTAISIQGEIHADQSATFSEKVKNLSSGRTLVQFHESGS